MITMIDDAKVTDILPPSGANIFEHIQTYGCDEGFEPRPAPRPTKARPGTRTKFNLLRARALLGMDLFHEDDPVDYEEIISPPGRPLPDGRRHNRIKFHGQTE
jgi:hypothetical protein